jgi:hypothetical protein
MARSLTSIGGTLIFAAALVLSLPGVRAVRADTAGSERGAVVQGPMCSAEQQRQGTITGVAFEELAARLRAHAEATAKDGKVQVQPLNSQGYNYANSDVRDIDPTRIAREYQLRREHGAR